MGTWRRLRILAIGAALATAALVAHATLIVTSGPRNYAPASSAPEDWADVFTTASGMGAELATNNQIVGIDGSNINDFEPSITEGNGCSLTLEASGAYDGEYAIKLVPPDTCLPSMPCGESSNAQYCAILNGVNITNGGSTDIAQINIRFVATLGPRYIDLASGPKWLSFHVSTTPGGVATNRAAVFEQYEANPAWANGRIYAVTSDEAQSWHEPEIPGCGYWDCGNPSEKSFIVRSTADHSGSPAVAGANEPIYFEMELDVRQNRGNANGRNRVYVRTRDGLINKTFDIPLSYEATWSFTWDQIIAIEGLGWYFNTAGTAHADNWIRYSHIAISSNRSVGDPIGPPPGFNTGFLLLLIVRLSWLRRIGYEVFGLACAAPGKPARECSAHDRCIRQRRRRLLRGRYAQRRRDRQRRLRPLRHRLDLLGRRSDGIGRRVRRADADHASRAFGRYFQNVSARRSEHRRANILSHDLGRAKPVLYRLGNVSRHCVGRYGR